MPLLLGLDIGTTSIKAVLHDVDGGKDLRTASLPTPVHHPRDGWSEHDSEELWQAAAGCIREAAGGKAVTGLAISSMAEAGVFIDQKGRSLGPIIAWYDRRSEPQAAWIEEHIPLADLYRITGQRVSPSFGVTKILWIRENMPEIYAQAAAWLPVPAYLLYRLTGERMVDYSIASRTLLFDQNTLGWSASLLDMLGLDPSLLPLTAPGGTPAGKLTRAASEVTGLPAGMPCALGGHDHLCASLAAGAYQPGSFVDSTGSANALLMLTSRFLSDPALGQRGYASYASVLAGLYALKGGLKAAGSAVEWLARQLSPGGSPDYNALEAAARTGTGRRAGPIWLPHLIGSGTPQGDRFSRAAVAGMQMEHQPGDLFRGLLESLAFWTRQNIEEMQVITGQRIPNITLIGGVTRLSLLSELKATITHLPIRLPSIPEAAATGAALLAGLGSDIFHSPAQASESLRYHVEQIDPFPEMVDWYDSLYQRAYLPLYDALKGVNDALEQASQKASGQHNSQGL